MELGVYRAGKKIKEIEKNEKNDELQIKQILDNPGMLERVSLSVTIFSLCF
jgi:hypothetical protein